jgi:hypothetical protein
MELAFLLRKYNKVLMGFVFIKPRLFRSTEMAWRV